MATEKRLIDANALKKKANMNGHCIRPLVTAYHLCVSVRDIDNAPTADAVEVIRCKDCKFYHEKGYCTKTTGLTRIKPDDFCSRGERKDNEV